jgi:hypothetical protein
MAASKIPKTLMRMMLFLIVLASGMLLLSVCVSSLLVWMLVDGWAVAFIFAGVVIESAVEIGEIPADEKRRKKFKKFATYVLIIGLGLDIPAVMKTSLEIAGLYKQTSDANERAATAEKAAAVAQKQAAREQKMMLLLQHGWEFDAQSVLKATKGFPLQTLDVFVCTGSGVRGPMNFASNLYRGINQTYFGADPKWSVRVWYIDFGSLPFTGVRVQISLSADKYAKAAADVIYRTLNESKIPTANVLEEFKDDSPPIFSNPMTGQLFPGKIFPVEGTSIGVWDGKKAASIRMIVGDIPLDFLNQ